MRPKAFHDFWSLAESLAAKNRPDDPSPELVFDCPAVGLILNAGDDQEFCDNTPTNSDTFARTGIDGTHFGFLRLPGVDDPPVVMTVPECAPGNTIVGGTFLEFLALGCREGYITLDALEHDREEAISTLQATTTFPASHGIDLLRAISDRFSLRPWPDVRARLDELQARYIHLLEFDPARRAAAHAAYKERMKGVINPFTGQPMA